MRLLKAALLYYATVFGVGVVLGTLRVLVVVPQLGVRAAELLEQPLMLVASFLLARWMLRRLGPFPPGRRLLVGGVALLLMVATELFLATWLQGRSLAQYVAGRDPVSGLVYLLSMLAFALMPLLAGHPHGFGPASRRRD